MRCAENFQSIVYVIKKRKVKEKFAWLNDRPIGVYSNENQVVEDFHYTQINVFMPKQSTIYPVTQLKAEGLPDPTWKTMAKNKIKQTIRSDETKCITKRGKYIRALFKHIYIYIEKSRKKKWKFVDESVKRNKNVQTTKCRIRAVRQSYTYYHVYMYICITNVYIKIQKDKERERNRERCNSNILISSTIVYINMCV